MNVQLLTHPLSETTPSFQDKDPIRILANESIAAGDSANTTDIRFSNNHIGTHVDVPRHFIDTGKTITDLPASEWVYTKVFLIDIPCQNPVLIDITDFENHKIPADTDFLIIRTGFENKRHQQAYWNAYPGISEAVCVYLRENFVKLRAIGFDFISLTSQQFIEEGKRAHRTLLGEKGGKFVCIYEDMKLSELYENPDMIVALPLYIQDGNGGPVTVMAFNR